MPNEEVVETTTVTETVVEEPVEYVPPTREEWEAHQKKLKKANDEAKHHRLTASELAAKNETEVEAAVRKAREDAANEVTSKYRPMVLKAAVRSALAEAGVLISTDKAMALVDLKDVDIDDDGTVTGVADAVRAAKRENPEFFGRKTPAQINAGDRDTTTNNNPRSAQEKIAAQLLGRK